MSWETSSAFCAGFGRFFFFLFPSSESLCHRLEVSSLRVLLSCWWEQERTHEDVAWASSSSFLLLVLLLEQCDTRVTFQLERKLLVGLKCRHLFIYFTLSRMWWVHSPLQVVEHIPLCVLSFCLLRPNFFWLAFSLLTEAGLLESKMFKFYEI